MDNETNDVKFQPGFSFKKAYDFPPAWKAENALKQVLGREFGLHLNVVFVNQPLFRSV